MAKKFAKKYDYYAVPEPWRMPKWLGGVLGGIFSLIIVGSCWLGYDLTRPIPERSAAILAPMPMAPTTPAAAPPVAPSGAVHAAVAQASPAAAAPVTARAHRHHHHHRVTVAVASRHASQNQHAAAIVARHQTRSDRKAKDDLDRLLGL